MSFSSYSSNNSELNKILSSFIGESEIENIENNNFNGLSD